MSENADDEFYDDDDDDDSLDETSIGEVSNTEMIETNEKVPDSSRDYMKQLTLELMVNKKHFKKVLERTDSTKYEQMKTHMAMVKKAYPMIFSMTEKLLTSYIKFGSADDYNEDIKNVFENYIHMCLDHIITTERNKNNENYIYHKETDVIFESLNEYTPTNVKNCWGKSIKKSM